MSIYIVIVMMADGNVIKPSFRFGGDRKICIRSFGVVIVMRNMSETIAGRRQWAVCDLDLLF